MHLKKKFLLKSHYYYKKLIKVKHRIINYNIIVFITFRKFMDKVSKIITLLSKHT